jgi:hypothetical protein
MFQMFFTASVFGQKYENGTRLLKGAEVLSATPLQLDYVLEKLADTAKITVNIHEGKTHLVLDEGSGKWNEWWYYMGKWQLKTTAETDPTVPAHVKNISRDNIAGWDRASANSHFHGNKNTIDGITSVDIARWGSAYSWGNHAAQGYLKTEIDPAWSAAKGNYYTNTDLQTGGQSQVHWDNITNRPASAGGYGITDVYTKAETRTVTGDTAKVLRQLIKNGSVTESDPTVPGHVKGITAANLTNWNTAYTNTHTHDNKSVLDGITAAKVADLTNAYNWGNHATQGYLKTESDPTVPAHVKGITTDNISNWNTAYNWGNHATQGYLNNYTLPTASSSTLGGVKTGNRISIAADGTISANPQAWTDITGKPTFASVATSGSYNDLKDKPVIPDGGLQVTSGNWSPSTPGGRFQSSRWIAIGRMVHISTILVMETSGTGLITIRGLPWEVSVNTDWVMSINRTGAASIPLAASIFQSGGTVIGITNHTYNTQGAYYISGTYLRK